MKTYKKLMLGYVVVSAAAMGCSVLYARRRLPAFGESGDDHFAIVAAMDGATFKSESASLVEGSATALFGGVEMDLADAAPGPAAHLKLRAVFGGVDVVVPATWRVEVAGRSIMGGVANLTSPDDVAVDAPVVLVDAIAVFGGIEIHAEDAS